MSQKCDGKPDEAGFFGNYGGQYVPDQLRTRLDELGSAFFEAINDAAFNRELQYLESHYAGRPSPVFYCRNLSGAIGGAQIWLKREDLNHLGAHKINNTLGQCLLAKRMGATRVVAETGAGQHGVATAASAALMGLECTIFMGEVDMRRQHLNVIRMEMLGARVVGAKSGQATLKEAVDEALDLWVSDPKMFYVLGSAVGPHPYPLMVRHFQSVIGKEARQQMLEETGRLPSACLACVGGGSNAIGIFAGFMDDPEVRLIGVEPGGRGNFYGEHAYTLSTKCARCCTSPRKPYAPSTCSVLKSAKIFAYRSISTGFVPFILENSSAYVFRSSVRRASGIFAFAWVTKETAS